MTQFHEDLIATAIDYLAAHHHEKPDLDDLAQKFGYESTHFQKMFKDKVGISPKRMMQYMQYIRARDFLLEGYPTLDAAYQTGLSSAGRLHDLFVSCEAATPGMVQKRGEGLDILYGYHPTPIGEILLAQSAIGVCWLGFVVDKDREEPLRRLRKHWPHAVFTRNDEATKESSDHIMRIWRGQGDTKSKLRLDLHGTNFQIQVWQALLKIPTGGTVSYQDVATALGDSKASRAVGTAVGANPISLLIPCHRVIQKSGIVENYAWGTQRKKIILGLEAENVAHIVQTGRLAV